MIRVTCSSCHTKSLLPAPPADGVFACGACGARMNVRPAGSAPRAPAPQHTAAPAPERVESRSRDGRPRPRRAEGERYRSYREGQGNTTLIWGVCGGVGALLLIGAVVLIFLLRDKEEAPKPLAKGPSNQFARGGLTPPPSRERPPEPPTDSGEGERDEPPPAAPPARSPERPPRNDPPRSEPPAEQPSDLGGNVGSSGEASGTGVYPYVLKSAVFIIALEEATPQGIRFGAGSGSLIDRKNRLVLTNDHVAGDAREVVVFFPAYQNGKVVVEKERFLRQFKDKRDLIMAKVLATDRRRDLCLLQLDRLPAGVEALPLSKTQAAPGQQVHSIGNPGASDGLWVYTSGTVRQVYRKKWRAGTPGDFSDHDAEVVETQSPTNPGDSGGPLVNDRGELVGVTQGGSPEAQLVSLFIDVTEVRRFIESTVESKLGHAWVADARSPLALTSRGGGNVTDLIKRLEHADAAQRAKAAETLGEMGENAKIAFSALLKVLKDKDELTRRLAAAALAKIGAPSASDLPLLVGSLKEQSVEMRQFAIDALGRMGPEARFAADAIVAALKDENAGVRQGATRALGKLGPEMKSTAVKELTALLDHKDKETRLAAAESLAGLLSTAADMPALQKLTKHPDAEVRAFAFVSLAKLGKDARGALPELLEAAKGDTGELRKAALMILLNLPPADAKPVVSMVNQAIKDGDKETKQLALRVVAKMGSDATSCSTNVKEALRDPELKKEALAAIGKLGAHAKSAVPSIVECVKDSDESLSDAGLKALGDLGVNGAAATNDLINLFDKARQTRTQEEGSAYLDKLAVVIAKFGRPAIPSLIKALEENNAMIRWGACKALGAMGPLAKEAERYLLAISEVDQNLFIRQEADKARRRVTAR